MNLQIDLSSHKPRKIQFKPIVRDEVRCLGIIDALDTDLALIKMVETVHLIIWMS
jgi:hypothetical protein